MKLTGNWRNFRALSEVPERRRGVTMVEGIMYLMLSLAVLVGGVMLFQQFRMNNNIVTMGRAMTSITNQIVAVERGSPFLSSLDLPEGEVDTFGRFDYSNFVARARFAPGSFISPDGDGLVSPWGGDIMIYAETVSSSDGTITGSGVFVVIRDLPQRACTRLAVTSTTGDTLMGRNQGMVIMNWDEDTPTQLPEMAEEGEVVDQWVLGDSGGLTPTEAATACEEGNGLYMLLPVTQY